jgi:3-phenylpropionate/cinnamic acid dioxygenase small subunit
VTLDAETKLALAGLVHGYAAFVDDRRFDDVADLFTADATLWLPTPPDSLEPNAFHRGHAEIRDAVAAVAAVQRSQHAIVGEVYTRRSGGEAHGRIACIAHHWSERNGEITDIAWHMRYDDEYVRSAEEWLFQSRALSIDAIEKRPARRLRR